MSEHAINIRIYTNPIVTRRNVGDREAKGKRLAN